MTQPKYSRSSDAKDAGWFSRRHRTPNAMLDCREARLAKKDQQLANILLRQEEYSKLSPKERLDKLNRLGYDAKKQRSKLTNLVT